ncbi:hypothetical protein HMPREF9103_02029, partial [Lentilactobacillus parafarraginis F0439]
NMAKYGFIAFIASIGFGFLVVKTPDAVKDFWASTGVTKSTGMVRRENVSKLFP